MGKDYRYGNYGNYAYAQAPQAPKMEITINQSAGPSSTPSPYASSSVGRRPPATAPPPPPSYVEPQPAYNPM